MQSPPPTTRQEKEKNSGDRFAKATNALNEASGFVVSPHLGELLTELVKVERRLDEIYAEVALEIKPHCKTPLQYGKYFDTFIKDFIVALWSPEEKVFYKSTTTNSDEERRMKRVVTVRMSRIKKRLMETLFPYLTMMKSFKKRVESLDKEFAKVTLTDEEMKKKVEDEESKPSSKVAVHKSNEEEEKKSVVGKLESNAFIMIQQFFLLNFTGAMETMIETGSCCSHPQNQDEFDELSADFLATLDVLFTQYQFETFLKDLIITDGVPSAKSSGDDEYEEDI